MRKTRVWKALAIIALGACPLATVSTCDYGPGGGTLFYDQIDDGYYYDDGYYDDGYYYDDCCFYDDDDDDD